jgi:hypothetical protein
MDIHTVSISANTHLLNTIYNKYETPARFLMGCHPQEASWNKGIEVLTGRIKLLKFQNASI